MVCIASSNGRITFEKPLLNAIQIPTGIPINKQIITAVKIIAIVVIMSSHNPKLPIRKINKLYNIPENTDLKYHPNRKMISIKHHQGMVTNKSSKKLMVLEEMKKIKSKNPSNVVSKKSTNCLT